MAKFYCPKCNGTMDEVEWSQFGMCRGCFEKLCKTCGKNEAINDVYQECESCIEEHRLEKELSRLMP